MADCLGVRNRAKNPTYDSWAHMKARCNNPNNKDYKWYGGRGVTICERWNLYENFALDMGIRPDKLTLDRIDGNGNYEPKNCRWIDRITQGRNKRNAKLFGNVQKVKELFKDGLNMAQIGRIFGCSRVSVWDLIHGITYKEE